jgi:hypothetical protein
MNRKTLTAALALSFCSLFLLQTPARAQQVDVAFGINTLTAPADTSASGDHFPQSLTGGLYPNFSGDVLFFHHLGVGGEVSWRASRSFFQGIGSQPFRPVFYDFNLVYAPPLGHKAQLDLQAGIGAESIRFYQNTYVCSFSGCTNYVSSNHFLGHLGVGIRFYAFGNFFVEPQAHVYLVHNNYEFSSLHANRYGLSIGYTFGSH